MNDVISLIKVTKTIDAYGDTIVSETSRDVFCEVKSVGYREFYQADTVGYKPSIVFVLADYYDYDEEQYVLYENVRYSIIRTYRKDNSLELTCEKDVIK